MSNPERSRTNRVVVASAFSAILLVATLVLIELGAFAMFQLAPDRFPSREAIQRSLAQREPESDDPLERSGSNVLHPYLGYVRNSDPEHKTRVNRLLVDDEVNPYGFLGESSIAPKSDDVVRIAFTGGSVAEELFLYGREAMAAELAASGAFGERRIEIVSAAVAGFKQPQQLFALSYLLVLGAQLDVVVNLDGFNEVVLPFTDNVPLNLAPSYPFRWKTVAAKGIDPGAAILIARIAESEKDLREWRALLDRFPLRHSAFVLATWQLLSERNETSRSRLQMELRERLGQNTNPQSGGPPFNQDAATGLAAEDLLFAHSAAIWRRSSEALASLCASRGIEYFHFLQPNRYYNWKRSTPRPRKAAPKVQSSENATSYGAETGYPLLVEEGAKLRSSGIRFVDLTTTFAGQREPIYRDNCCHFFAHGYEIVARRIAAEIVAATLADRAVEDSSPASN